MHPCRLRGCKNIRGQSWRSIRNCRLWQIRVRWARGPADLADFFRPPTLTSDIFAALWSTRTYSTSFERSNSYLFKEWKPRPWHDFYYDLWSLKVPSFHIIQWPLLKQKLPALYLLRIIIILIKIQALLMKFWRVNRWAITLDLVKVHSKTTYDIYRWFSEIRLKNTVLCSRILFIIFEVIKVFLLKIHKVQGRSWEFQFMGSKLVWEMKKS